MNEMQPANSAKSKILVVDDNALNLVAMKRLLAKVDAEVILADCGNQALALALEHDFALILLDVQMPDIDGYEVANLLRGEERTCGIPIIFLTAAFKDEQHRLLGYESGAVDYLDKPINDTVLLAKVRIFLELRRKEDLLRAMTLLAQREREFRTLAENSPDILVRYDREGHIVYANPKFEVQNGIRLEEVIGKLPAKIFQRGDVLHLSQRVQKVVQTGLCDEFEHPVQAADGSFFWGLTFIVPEFDAAGRVAYVQATTRDITERKRYEDARDEALAEAKRLAKVRSEFITHMSHELRTPLNGILGYVQILQRDSVVAERNATALNVIRESGEHLRMLVNEILDLASIEAGQLKLAVGNIPLAVFARIVVDTVGVKARQKGIELICELADDLPEVIAGDEKRLRQVLLNLLANAVKFTERGRVVLRISQVFPSRLAFAVEDTGIGIAANEIEAIFQPFEQSDGVHQRFGGSGLGLSISRQLVRMMGGEITVESRLGEGCTFRFELNLPAVDDASPAAQGIPFSGELRIEAVLEDELSESMVLPPDDAIQNLHRLARGGDMRDIVQYAENIAGLDPVYLPFASRLRGMAEAYQSKAILAFVEQSLARIADESLPG